MDNANLSRIYDDAGRPGARLFRTAARRQGVAISMQQSQEFVSRQSEAQTLQARLPSDGKVVSARTDSRWQVDLIDYSKRNAAKNFNFKYLLTVIDIFSKFLWIERMSTKEDSATLAAYRRVISRNGGKHPLEVSVDLGREFGPTFEAYLKDNGTVLRKKDPISINTLASIDRAQQSLKKIIANLQASTDVGWASLSKRAETIYSDREHSALYGESPSGVIENQEVQYLLEAESGKSIRHNNNRWRSKAGRLTDKGGFRVPQPRSTWERIDQAKFGGVVHKVSELKGANVTDTEGRSYPVRKVLAVPAESADIALNEELVPGSGKRAEQLQGLRVYAEQLRNELSRTARGEMSFTRARQFLRTRGNWDEAAARYRLPVSGRFVKFLFLFRFRISGTGRTMMVKPPLPSAPQAPAAPRQAEVAPRRPRTDMPGTQTIQFGPNQKRGGTATYARYEIYKSATTIAEARRLGMTPMDLKDAVARGQATLL